MKKKKAKNTTTNVVLGIDIIPSPRFLEQHHDTVSMRISQSRQKLAPMSPVHLDESKSVMNLKMNKNLSSGEEQFMMSPDMSATKISDFDLKTPDVFENTAR